MQQNNPPRRFRHRHQSPSRRSFRPSLEALEARLAPATIQWTNLAGGDWNVAGNWDLNRLPQVGDEVIIDVPGMVTVTHASGTTAVASLTSQESLALSGGTLTVSGPLTSPALSLTGGTLSGAVVTPGSTVTASGGTLDSVTLDGTLNLPGSGAFAVVTNGLTLNGTITAGGFATNLRFQGSQTLGGTGTIVFGNSYGLVSMGAGDVLTIGTGVTVRGFNFAVGAMGVLGAAGTFVNHGTLISDGAANGEMVLSGDGWRNEGTVTVGPGKVFYASYNSQTRPWTNTGTMTFAGSTATLLGGQWTNTGTIEVTDGAVVTDQSVLANYSSGTLTGGTWKVGAGSTLRLATGAITTNAADLVLDGAGSNLYQGATGTTSVLSQLASIAAGGRLTLSGGRSLTLNGSLSNAGDLVVGAGSTLNVTSNGIPGTQESYTQTAGSTAIDGSLVLGTPVPQPTVGNPGTYVPADGSAVDVAGGHNGTLVNGATYGQGIRGQGFQLDGVNDYVNLGTSPDFDVTDFTIAAWVFVDPATNVGSQRVISRDDFSNPGGDGREIYTLLSSTSGSSGHPEFYVGRGLTAAGGTAVDAPGPLTAGWHHLAGVRDGTTLRLYVDGVEVAIATTTVTGVLSPEAPLVLGQVSPDYNGAFFKGTIDEFHFYNQALSAAEMQTLYISVGPNPSPVPTGGKAVLAGGMLTGGGSISGTVINSAGVAVGSPLGKLTVTGDYTQTAAGSLAVDLGGTTQGGSTPVGTDALIPVATYDMPNGDTGGYGTLRYWDDTYSPGPPTADGQYLSGGKGQLTDGVVAPTSWNANATDSYPYVAWGYGVTPNPTITFHFAQPYVFDRVRIHVDDPNGYGAVYPPASVSVSMSGQPVVSRAVTDPPSASPFWVEVDLDGWQTDELQVQIFQVTGQWVFVSEVQFLGHDVPASTGVYDYLAVSGTATLDGSLQVALANGFQPAAGDSFRVLTFGNRSGDFAGYTGLTQGSVALTSSYTGTALTLGATQNNAAPVLTLPSLPTGLDEGQPFAFTATATDDGNPAALVYSLLNAPAGAGIDPQTGVFSWTPTEAQGPGSFTFTVIVSDGTLTDQKQITLTVDEVNQAPTLDPIGDRQVDEGQVLTFTAHASDPDLPTNALTFSLVGAPAGAGIDPTTGAFAWTPSPDQYLKRFTFTVLVTDDGVPALSDSETITVTVGSIFTVVNTSDSGPGSLRQALLSANANPGLDLIEFAIPGAGVRTIVPLTALPGITDAVLLDATTQPGFAGTPLIELSGTAAGANVNGLLVSSSGSTVRGLIITRFGGHGISVSGASNTHIEGNYIGTDPAGSAGLGNRFDGVAVWNGSSGNFVGGVTPGEGNVISANGRYGIYILGPTSAGNVVQGNRIGTDPTGTAGLGNTGQGVRIENAPNNTIGGTGPGAGNLISASGNIGVALLGTGASGNVVQGNLIGTDATGNLPLGNRGQGSVYIQNAPANIVSGNVIAAGQTRGVEVRGSASTGNRVVGNFIGTNAAGTSGLGNGSDGIAIYDNASTTFIGGTAVGEGNVISANGRYGIYILGPTSGGNVVQGNRIGTDPTGTAGLGNTHQGVRIENAPNNTVGGTGPGAGNLISDNRSIGVALLGTGASGNVVQGNLIGTDATGNLPLGNRGQGSVYIQNAPANTVSGNVIAAGQTHGIEIGGAAATGNRILGNFIGTNAAGAAGLGNGINGVVVASGAWANFIGGPGPGEGNVISGNAGHGIGVFSATGNMIQGNRIGTDPAGATALPNLGAGIALADSAENTIGGTTPGAGNVVSGNGWYGIDVTGPGAGRNVIQGNYIGTTADGLRALGNANNGVVIFDGDGNLIGGADPGAGNVISGNGFFGVALAGATGTIVQGNRIGTDVTGTVALGNAQAGVDLESGSAGNLIGGAAPGEGNLISASLDGAGVVLKWDATGNRVQGNRIGTDVTGNAPLGNRYGGIRLYNGASGNLLGGLEPGEGNTIAYNGLGGVLLFTDTATGNSIRGNSLHDNDGLGIDLGGDGFTANDPGDPDTGPNGQQNYPVLHQAQWGATTRIVGTVNSTPSTTLTIDFYANPAADPSGYGEGQRYLGSTTAITDAAGDASFEVTLSVTTANGEWVTATATGPDGGTSEFSAALRVNLPPTLAPVGNFEVDEGRTLSFTVDATDADLPAQALTFSLVDAPIGATIDPQTGAFSWTPSEDQAPGTFTFAVVVTDGDGSSDTAMVTITVVNLVDLFGRVFLDNNNDGIFNDSDAGLADVAVEVWDQAMAIRYARTTTVTDGTWFLNANLSPGTYRVVEVIDEQNDLGLLDGKETAGALGGTVVNGQDSNTIGEITVRTGDADAGGYNFAEIRPSRLQGLVWVDFNDDGEINYGEAAVCAATITLTGLDDRGNPVSLTMQTDSQGIFEFSDLRPGNYTITETQPAGLADGREGLGEVNGVPTGTVTADSFSGVSLALPGSYGMNYNFGERPLPGSSAGSDQTAGIGFWHNKHGQNLLRSLNGGPSSKKLGDWLASTFTNMYGSLAGKTNAEVADLFLLLFKLTGKTAPGGPPKLDAEVLAGAFAVYVTNSTLAGNAAASYGFQVNDTGVGYSTVNVGSSGAAFGVANNTTMTVMDLLLAVNGRTSSAGLMYDLDGSGIISSSEQTLRELAHRVFSRLNDGGGI